MPAASSFQEIAHTPREIACMQRGKLQNHCSAIELGRRGFTNDSRIIRSNLKRNAEVLKTTALR